MTEKSGLNNSAIKSVPQSSCNLGPTLVFRQFKQSHPYCHLTDISHSTSLSHHALYSSPYGIVGQPFAYRPARVILRVQKLAEYQHSATLQADSIRVILWRHMSVSVIQLPGAMIARSPISWIMPGSGARPSERSMQLRPEIRTRC